jgi:hypothetical protein
MIDYREPPEHLVRSELRRAVDSRTPDRTAMLNRIAANRAADARRPRHQLVRLAGSALAVATVLGLGGMAKWALADEDQGSPPPVAVAPGPATSAAVSDPATAGSTPHSTSPSSRPHSSAPGSPSTSASSAATPVPTASLVRGHPGDTKTDKGSLRSTSATAAGLNRVTLIPGAALTTLSLDIRVPLTPGLTAGTGTTDAPAGAVTATVQKASDALIYHFVLAQDKALQAGTWTFTATYGGGARNIAGDTYEAYAYSVERKDIHVYGNFLPTE